MPKLPSTAEPQKTAWYSEAARTVSTWIAGVVVLLGGIAAAASSFTDVVPEKYRERYLAAVAIVTAVAAGLVKVQGAITRRNVYSSSTHYAALNDVADIVEKRKSARQSTVEGPDISLPVAPTIPIPGDPGPSGQEAERQGLGAAGTAAPPTSAIDWAPRHAADPNDPAFR